MGKLNTKTQRSLRIFRVGRFVFKNLPEYFRVWRPRWTPNGRTRCGTETLSLSVSSEAGDESRLGFCGFNFDQVAFELNNLAGADLAALSQFLLSVNGNHALADDHLTLCTGHNQVGHLQQFAEFNVFVFNGYFHESLDRGYDASASFLIRRISSSFLKGMRLRL